jgi:hypothetical protein
MVCEMFHKQTGNASELLGRVLTDITAKRISSDFDFRVTNPINVSTASVIANEPTIGNEFTV